MLFQRSEVYFVDVSVEMEPLLSRYMSASGRMSAAVGSSRDGKGEMRTQERNAILWLPYVLSRFQDQIR